jgi:hypothetical protein
MQNLQAEMLRHAVKIPDIMQSIKCSEKTARNKVNGITDFSYPEAKRIHDDFFPTLRMEYLFATDDNGRQTN